MPRERLHFGPFLLEEQSGELRRDGELLALTPRAHDTLRCLLSCPGRLFTREELLAAVWPGTNVEENNLSQQISSLRKLLGEGWIETVPRRGYRFVGEVRVAEIGHADLRVTAAAGALPAADTPTRRRSLAWVVAAALLAVAAGVVVLQQLPEEGRKRAWASPPIRSVAVLPFAPLVVADGRNDPVGLGLADELIERLGAGGSVAVRPIAAVRGFDSRSDARAAARRLRVDAVLHGSFRWAAGKVLVQVRLFDVRQGADVWAAPFEAEAGEMALLQDEMATALGRFLAVPGGAGPAVYTRRHSTDPEAYGAYLRGRWHWSRRAAGDLREAERAFAASLARDPDYAAAYAGLADALLTQARYEEARAAAAHALALDDSQAAPYATLGFLAWFHDHDAAAAQTELGRAIELNPSYATAYQWLAFVHVTRQHCAQAGEAIGRASGLDPVSLTIATDVASIHYYCGRFDAAEREVRAALRLDPNFAQAHQVLVQVLVEQGRYAEAAEAFEELTRFVGASPALQVELLARWGKRDAAERVAKAIADFDSAGRSTHGEYPIARALAQVGRLDEAVHYLERAVANGESDAMLLGVDPAAAPLRDDPRAQELLHRLGLAAPGR